MTDDAHIMAAASLLDDLKSSCLQVTKIPTDSGYIRVAVSTNPSWYSRMCQKYLDNGRKYRPTNRRYYKYRTIIKRCTIISVLTNYINRRYKCCGGIFKEPENLKRVMPFIRERVDDIAAGYEAVCHSSTTDDEFAYSAPW